LAVKTKGVTAETVVAAETAAVVTAAEAAEAGVDLKGSRNGTA